MHLGFWVRNDDIQIYQSLFEFIIHNLISIYLNLVCYNTINAYQNTINTLYKNRIVFLA